MDVAALETHIGVQLASGVSCGPGTLLNMYSGSSTATTAGIARARLASQSASLPAHGFALTSGSGTKVTGIAQRVRMDRVGKVVNVDYADFGPGQTVYLSTVGQYTASSAGLTLTQKVGFAVAHHEVFVDLDMQLGA